MDVNARPRRKGLLSTAHARVPSGSIALCASTRMIGSALLGKLVDLLSGGIGRRHGARLLVFMVLALPFALSMAVVVAHGRDDRMVTEVTVVIVVLVIFILVLVLSSGGEDQILA